MPADSRTTAAVESAPITVSLTETQWFVVLNLLETVYREEIRPFLGEMAARKVDPQTLPAAQLKEIGGITIARNAIADALIDAGVLAKNTSEEGREVVGPGPDMGGSSPTILLK